MFRKLAIPLVLMLGLAAEDKKPEDVKQQLVAKDLELAALHQQVAQLTGQLNASTLMLNHAMNELVNCSVAKESMKVPPPSPEAKK